MHIIRSFAACEPGDRQGPRGQSPGLCSLPGPGPRQVLTTWPLGPEVTGCAALTAPGTLGAGSN
jgi:hypothetical protein